MSSPLTNNYQMTGLISATSGLIVNSGGRISLEIHTGLYWMLIIKIKKTAGNDRQSIFNFQIFILKIT